LRARGKGRVGGGRKGEGEKRGEEKEGVTGTEWSKMVVRVGMGVWLYFTGTLEYYV
jgi:hypothetical protein